MMPPQSQKRVIHIEISNRQSVCSLARQRITALLTFLLHRSRRSAASPDNTALTLLVTDNRHMPDFKYRCFGIREVTDVIAATYNPLPDESTWEAELVVNAERALDVVTERDCSARQVRVSGPDASVWNVSSEFALYLAHGVDHLTGADDATPRDRRRMRRRELGWLREAERKGLIDELLVPTEKRRQKSS